MTITFLNPNSPNLAPTRIWSRHHPFWSVAFRPFFLSAACFAAVSMIAWALHLNGSLSTLGGADLPPIIWHVHEMLFGFAATCALGFLLTAVQNWTGLRSAYGYSLALLLLAWLFARIAIWNQQLLAAVIFQSLWWFGCLLFLGRCLVRAKSKRNYQFIPLMLVLASLNIAILLLSYHKDFELALHMARTSILMFGILVGIVGGRVIPHFTRNATGSREIKDSRKLNIAILAIGISGSLAFFTGKFFQLPFTPAPFMLAAGGLHLVRLYQWDSRSSLGNPLLWSLHATYLCLGTGLLSLGMSYSFEAIQFADALHLQAVGTIGGMILAMISRVSLGHTGRPLHTNHYIALAFTFVLCAAASRSLLPMFGWQTFSWNSSAALWSMAFLLFAVFYAPILFKQPRH